MINLIAGVTLTANYKLAIGRNGDLLFKITDDMKFFKLFYKKQPEGFIFRAFSCFRD